MGTDRLLVGLVQPAAEFGEEFVGGDALPPRATADASVQSEEAAVVGVPQARPLFMFHPDAPLRMAWNMSLIGLLVSAGDTPSDSAH